MDLSALYQYYNLMIHNYDTYNKNEEVLINSTKVYVKNGSECTLPIL